MDDIFQKSIHSLLKKSIQNIIKCGTWSFRVCYFYILYLQRAQKVCARRHGLKIGCGEKLRKGGGGGGW